MKKIIRLTESDLHRIVKNSVKTVLKEGQYEKGYNNGQRLIQTRIERYGEEKGRQELELLYHTMLSNLDDSRNIGLTTNVFLKGQVDAIEKYLNC